MRIVETRDVSVIRPLQDAWLGIARGDEFGLTIDSGHFERKLRIMISDGALLVAYEQDRPVGFFALAPVESSLSEQTIVTELYWFSLSGSMAGPRLLEAAERWTAAHGYSHLMLCSSRLASDMHDKVCQYCEHIGAKPFETVYIMQVTADAPSVDDMCREDVDIFERSNDILETVL